MRQPIIAGNWKMNGTRSETQALLFAIKDQAHLLAPAVQMIVFPPSIYLEQTEEMLAGTTIAWGGQNFFPEAKGAFTGEISANMLADVGCRYAIVGHSERRNLFGETDEQVARKFKIAVEAGLTPIICVGETLQEREKGLTYSVLRRQMDALFLVGDGATPFIQAVLAYEPVWAIGTGINAEPEMAEEVHAQLRAWVAEHDKTIAESLRILYGGSLKRDNASALLSMPNIDGGLIGGASLIASEFLDIAHICNSLS